MLKPYTIGITGGSGSGKTFFIDSLASRFTPNEVCLISQDHYYKARDLQFTDEQGVKNFDLPSAIERERFHGDILKLKRGETLRIAEYTFNNPAATPRTDRKSTRLNSSHGSISYAVFCLKKKKKKITIK